MSILIHSEGQFTYHDALDMTAVPEADSSYPESWPGERPGSFRPAHVYENDMRKANEAVQLVTWRDEAYRTVYVSGDRIRIPRVEHPARLAFDAF